MNLYAVLLCGGKGERFWPKSRSNLPKQFVTLFGGKSLLEMTSERIKELCPVSRQLFVAHQRFAKLLIRELKAKQKNLILEPARKDTAPAIGLSAVILSRRDPEAIMVVLPADHIITPKRKFLSAVKVAAVLAQKGYLVTFGVVPTRADTGYGYIQYGEEVYRQGKICGYRVLEFKEKPDLKTAEQYLKSGNYLWNSGMFVWRVDMILEAFHRYMPQFYQSLLSFSQTLGSQREKMAIKRLYQKAPAISIDYGVMEKAENVCVVRAPFIWDDVGGWLALARHFPQDQNGNVVKGLWFGKNTKDCICYADQGVLATLGITGLVIVRSGDAVMVAEKNALSQLKDLLTEIAQDRQGRKFL
ncbi:MAG: mannose-1-phosphate guanylyltransferase [candidate division WOR-3 bacterium]